MSDDLIEQANRIINEAETALERQRETRIRFGIVLSVVSTVVLWYLLLSLVLKLF